MLALAAAPLSWVPFLAFVAAPALWAGLGMLLRGGNRRAAGLLLGGHTLASASTVVLGSPTEPGSEQWSYLAQAQQAVPALLWAGVLLYLLGLCMAWRLVLHAPAGQGEAG